MKCVRQNDSGIVTRATNEKAYELVKSGKYSYSSKEAWKKTGRLYHKG